jgi:hypothetical protein
VVPVAGGCEPRIRSVDPAWKTISTERSAPNPVTFIEVRWKLFTSQPLALIRSFEGWLNLTVSSSPEPPPVTTYSPQTVPTAAFGAGLGAPPNVEERMMIGGA